MLSDINHINFDVRAVAYSIILNRYSAYGRLSIMLTTMALVAVLLVCVDVLLMNDGNVSLAVGDDGGGF